MSPDSGVGSGRESTPSGEDASRGAGGQGAGRLAGQPRDGAVEIAAEGRPSAGGRVAGIRV